MDAEEAAIGELSRRIGRWRMGIVSAGVVAGVVVGIVGYWWFREVQVGANGAHAPWLTGAATFGAGLAVMGIAWLLARLVVRARRKAWVEEIAARHGVPAETLDDVADAIG